MRGESGGVCSCGGYDYEARRPTLLVIMREYLVDQGGLAQVRLKQQAGRKEEGNDWRG